MPRKKSNTVPAPGTRPTRGGKPTKKEMVRQALAELGNDAMPIAIEKFVKDHFHVKMTTKHISTTKGDLLRGKPAKGKKKAAPQASAASAPRGPRASSLAIDLDDVLAVKALVGRVGPEPLRALIAAMTR